MNSKANWALKVREKVYKDISRFPVEDRERIIRVIENLPNNPYAGDIEKMKGEERMWRRRIGDYRIFYEIIPQDRVIYVFKVERRTSNTY